MVDNCRVEVRLYRVSGQKQGLWWTDRLLALEARHVIFFEGNEPEIALSLGFNSWTEDEIAPFPDNSRRTGSAFPRLLSAGEENCWPRLGRLSRLWKEHFKEPLSLAVEKADFEDLHTSFSNNSGYFMPFIRWWTGRDERKWEERETGNYKHQMSSAGHDLGMSNLLVCAPTTRPPDCPNSL